MIRRLFAALILVCLVSPAYAGSIIIAKKKGGAPAPCTGSAPSNCTIRETFNGANECAATYTSNCSMAADFWTVAAGTPDFDNASYPKSGQTYALYMTGSAQIRNTNNLSASDEWYQAVPMYVETRGAVTALLAFKNGTTTLCRMDSTTGGVITVLAAGGTASSTIATVADGNAYYLKLRYKLGTGANAECQGWVSTDGTTWSTTQSSTDGTSTAQATRIYPFSGASSKWHYQEIRVYTGDISW